MQSRLALAVTLVVLALLAGGCSGGGGGSSSGGASTAAPATSQTVSTPTTVTPSPTPTPAPAAAVTSGWQSLALTNVVASAIAIDPADSRHVYVATSSTLEVTRDAGAHWSDLGARLPGGTDAVDAVAFDPAHPGTAYVFVAGMNPRLAKTTDDGQTFLALGLTLGSKLLGSITLDPSNSATVYVAATTPDTAITPLVPQIWRSTDSGATFTALSPAISGMLITVVVDPLTATTLYAATTADVNASKPGGLWKSIDGGKTFALTGAATLGNDPFFMSALAPQHQQVIALDPTNPATIYAAGQSGGVGTFNVSKDGGATWSNFVMTGVPADFFDGVIVDPLEPATLYLYGGNGSGTGTTVVLKSKDAGASFSPIQSGFSTTIAGLAGGLALAPNAPRTLYAGFPGAPLYATTTGGE